MNSVYLLLDSQPLYKDAVEQLIQKNLQPKEIIRCRDINSAYRQLREKHVDLLLTDFEVEDGCTIDLVKRARCSGFDGQVLFLSSKGYPTYSSLACSVGAQGYVAKTEDSDTIIKAIKLVKSDYQFFKSSQTTDLQQVNLSSRELMVYNYLQQGYSNKQISEMLSLSAKTVSTYKSRILKKFKVDSLIQLFNNNATDLLPPH